MQQPAVAAPAAAPRPRSWLGDVRRGEPLVWVNGRNRGKCYFEAWKADSRGYSDGQYCIVTFAGGARLHTNAKFLARAPEAPLPQPNYYAAFSMGNHRHLHTTAPVL